MKKRIFVAAGALILQMFSCKVEDRVSVQVLYVMYDVPDKDCVVAKSETQKGGGSIDLGYTNAYLLALYVKSNLDSASIQAGGQTTNPASRNDFYVQEVVLNYRGSFVDIPEQVSPSAGTVLAGGELFWGMNVITSDAAAGLAEAVLEANARGLEALEVIVSITLRGTFANDSEYETAPFDFPITVYMTSPVPCPDPVRQMYGAVSDDALVPACQNWGQDGIPFTCVCRPDCGGCGLGTKCNTDTCACEASSS
jgi:hypothetical protein